MGHIAVTECEIEGLKIICPQKHMDDRGYFMEVYRSDVYERYGVACSFVQDNRARSKKGVLRGLHFQKEFPQDKLIWAAKGEIFDVAVDMRKASQTLGKWFGCVLSEENGRQFFVPKGFAHGYLVLSEEAEVMYKCSDIYHPGDEGGLMWNDPDIGVSWPKLEGTGILLSEKDRAWPSWQDWCEEAGIL